MSREPADGKDVPEAKATSLPSKPRADRAGDPSLRDILRKVVRDEARDASRDASWPDGLAAAIRDANQPETIVQSTRFEPLREPAAPATDYLPLQLTAEQMRTLQRAQSPRPWFLLMLAAVIVVPIGVLGGLTLLGQRTVHVPEPQLASASGAATSSGIWSAV